MTSRAKVRKFSREPAKSITMMYSTVVAPPATPGRRRSPRDF